ncbi:MAG: DUF4903 domain-containing protein, partial [Tannerella sp.]|nr:DUF4903 domain-containing protein [Tannerella sp.]
MILGKIVKNIFLAFSLMAILSYVFPSCKADEEIVQKSVSDENLSVAKEILRDSIVLNARAMMGTVNKTLLEKGCPIKYYFSWKGNDSLNIQIRAFTVGKMPLRIWYTVNVKIMQLNTWEKQEYTGPGWIKFHGDNGLTLYDAITDEYEDGNGGNGSSTGYFNAETQEIEFITNFNV